MAQRENDTTYCMSSVSPGPDECNQMFKQNKVLVNKPQIGRDREQIHVFPCIFDPSNPPQHCEGN